MPWELRFAVPDFADLIIDTKGAIAVHLDNFPSNFLPSTRGESQRSTSNPTWSKFRSIGKDTTLCGCRLSVGDLTGTFWGTFLVLLFAGLWCRGRGRFLTSLLKDSNMCRQKTCLYQVT